MPHVSRYLPFLLILASCSTPSQEPDTGGAPESWSRRAWRSSDRPSIVDGMTSRRLRSWAKADADPDEAGTKQVGAGVEPVTVESEVVEEHAAPAPEVPVTVPESEPMGEEPEPIEISAPVEEPPAIETPAPVETPVPFEAPAPAEPAQLVDLRASIVLMWYFQRDDDPSALSRNELELAFEQYDWNKNGVVIGLEFDATTGSSAPFGREPEGEALALMGDASPLDAVLAAVDSDGDSAFSLSELLAFHGQRFGVELN